MVIIGHNLKVMSTELPISKKIQFCLEDPYKIINFSTYLSGILDLVLLAYICITYMVLWFSAQEECFLPRMSRSLRDYGVFVYIVSRH